MNTSGENKVRTDKPGFKTTEFWLSTLATIGGLVLASGVLGTMGSTGDTISVVVGAAIALLASLGYTGARTELKKSQDPINFSSLTTGINKWIDYIDRNTAVDSEPEEGLKEELNAKIDQHADAEDEKS